MSSAITLNHNSSSLISVFYRNKMKSEQFIALLFKTPHPPLNLKEASSSSSSSLSPASWMLQCFTLPSSSSVLPPQLPPCYIPPLLRCHGNMSDCLAICSALSSRWAPFCCASECSCVCRDRNTFLHLRFLSSADAHRQLSVSAPQNAVNELGAI